MALIYPDPFTPGEVLTAQRLNENFEFRDNNTPQDNIVLIEGMKLQATGTAKPGPFKYLAYGGGTIYAATMTIPTPYAPPQGYGFDVYPLNTSGFTFTSVASQTPETIQVRVAQIANGSPISLTLVGWRLCRIS